MAADPIHQFQINKLATILKVGASEIAFTNSALSMAIGVALITVLVVVVSLRPAVVPARVHSLVEISCGFVGVTLNNAAGDARMKFFPFVFTIFMFVLFATVLGLLPYAFTVTSHII